MTNPLSGVWWSVHLPSDGDWGMLDKIESALSLLHEAVGVDITFHNIPYDTARDCHL